MVCGQSVWTAHLLVCSQWADQQFRLFICSPWAVQTAHHEERSRQAFQIVCPLLMSRHPQLLMWSQWEIWRASLLTVIRWTAGLHMVIRWTVWIISMLMVRRQTIWTLNTPPPSEQMVLVRWANQLYQCCLLAQNWSQKLWLFTKHSGKMTDFSELKPWQTYKLCTKTMDGVLSPFCSCDITLFWQLNPLFTNNTSLSCWRVVAKGFLLVFLAPLRLRQNFSESQ